MTKYVPADASVTLESDSATPDPFDDASASTVTPSVEMTCTARSAMVSELVSLPDGQLPSPDCGLSS